MYRAFYEGMSFSWLPITTTVFFVVFFTGVVLKTYVFKGSKDFERVAALPLDESEVKK